jgi:hypothetical protein
MVLDTILNERGQNGDNISPLTSESVMHLTVIGGVYNSLSYAFFLKVTKSKRECSWCQA